MKRSCCALLLAACFFAQAAGLQIHRVDAHIYTGRQPHRDEYPELAHQGIKTILDLRGGPIHKPHEQKLAEAAGLKYISMRLSGIWEPHDKQIASIMAVMNDSSRWPIFIHCRRGDDRLGMVVACYRMTHDHWSNQQAYDEATHDGMSRFEVLMRSYIRHFDAGKEQLLQESLPAGHP